MEKINELIPGCITLKPMVYLINMSKRNFNAGKNKYLPRIKEWVDAHGGGLVIPLSIEFEEELFAMESSGDDVGKAALLAEVSVYW